MFSSNLFRTQYDMYHSVIYRGSYVMNMYMSSLSRAPTTPRYMSGPIFGCSPPSDFLVLHLATKPRPNARNHDRRPSIQ